MRILLALMVGAIIGGAWVQYRFSGTLWSNSPKPELCGKVGLNYVSDIKERLGLACEYWQSPTAGKGFHFPLDEITEEKLEEKWNWLKSGEVDYPPSPQL